MHLLGARLVGVGPFEDVRFPFSDDEGEARMVTVVHGGGGVGKTTLLACVAATRPGHSVALLPEPENQPESAGPAFCVCDWRLGIDEPERPHPLQVATPTARLSTEDQQEVFRRREQALFDRMAKEGGFACAVLPAGRWFSRQPLTLQAPARTVARYDVRGQTALDDASRSDLARETKQALAYAEIVQALAGRRPGRDRRLEQLGATMHDAVNSLVELAGFEYRGVDPRSLEPVFVSTHGRVRSFDGLPTRVRHLVAIAALSVRTLSAAYPLRDPATAEGVILIDEVDLHQESSILDGLVPALRSVLPGVQWILTTSSSVVAGTLDTRDVLALRRSSDQGRVDLFLGSEARTH
ncbi:hypothetical protein ACFL5O_02995 [Myxococcota bacterium]